MLERRVADCEEEEERLISEIDAVKKEMPNSAAAAVKDAMATQVAPLILEKLRGKEAVDAMEVVVSRKLNGGDQEFRRAVEEAMSSALGGAEPARNEGAAAAAGGGPGPKAVRAGGSGGRKSGTGISGGSGTSEGAGAAASFKRAVHEAVSEALRSVSASGGNKSESASGSDGIATLSSTAELDSIMKVR